MPSVGLKLCLLVQPRGGWHNQRRLLAVRAPQSHTPTLSPLSSCLSAAVLQQAAALPHNYAAWPLVALMALTVYAAFPPALAGAIDEDFGFMSVGEQCLHLEACLAVVRPREARLRGTARAAAAGACSVLPSVQLCM